ncbi:hypothetical protein F4819DRAFT_483809 [Hypoxylon fuscum]|nr:hypothetical protein F4819DRAFT_483809 [Hypoxylon fuscum]
MAGGKRTSRDPGRDRVKRIKLTQHPPEETSVIGEHERLELLKEHLAGLGTEFYLKASGDYERTTAFITQAKLWCDRKLNPDSPEMINVALFSNEDGLIQLPWKEDYWESPMPVLGCTWIMTRAIMFAEAVAKRPLIHPTHFLAQLVEAPLMIEATSSAGVQAFQSHYEYPPVDISTEMKPRCASITGDDLMEWHAMAKSIIRKDLMGIPSFVYQVEDEINLFDPRKELSKSRPYAKIREAIQRKELPSLVAVEAFRCTNLGSYTPIKKLLEECGATFMLAQDMYWTENPTQLLSPEGIEYGFEVLPRQNRPLKLEKDLEHWRRYKEWPKEDTLNDLRTERNRLEMERAALEHKSSRLEQENASHQEMIISLQGENARTQEIVTNLQEENAGLQGKTTDLQSENATKQEVIINLQQENTSKQEIITNLQDENASLQGKNTSLEHNVSRWQEENSSLRENAHSQDDVANLRRKITRLRKKNASLKQKKARFQRKIGHLRKENVSLGHRDSRLQEKIANLRKKITSIRRKKSRLRKKIEDASLERRDSRLQEREIASLREKNASLRKENAQFRNENTRLVNAGSVQTDSRLQEENGSLREENVHSRDTISRLNEYIASLNDKQRKSRAGFQPTREPPRAPDGSRN